MADLHDAAEVLRRAREDQAFRARVQDDPVGALAGVELDEAQLRELEAVVLGDDVVGFGSPDGVRGLFGADDPDA